MDPDTDRDGVPLYSFAVVTDEPPPEIAEARHDRCINPIKRENLDAWLVPTTDLSTLYSALDNREMPYFEHRLGA